MSAIETVHQSVEKRNATTAMTITHPVVKIITQTTTQKAVIEITMPTALVSVIMRADLQIAVEAEVAVREAYVRPLVVTRRDHVRRQTNTKTSPQILPFMWTTLP